jgi:hypothetical protein
LECVHRLNQGLHGGDGVVVDDGDQRHSFGLREAATVDYADLLDKGRLARLAGTCATIIDERRLAQYLLKLTENEDFHFLPFLPLLHILLDYPLNRRLLPGPFIVWTTDAAER